MISKFLQGGEWQFEFRGWKCGNQVTTICGTNYKNQHPETTHYKPHRSFSSLVCPTWNALIKTCYSSQIQINIPGLNKMKKGEIVICESYKQMKFILKPDKCNCTNFNMWYSFTADFIPKWSLLYIIYSRENINGYMFAFTHLSNKNIH